MKQVAITLLGALRRQRAIEDLSPAARALEQRHLDRIAREAEVAVNASDTEASLVDRCHPYIERLLASQGDAAEPALVKLQHDLTRARIGGGSKEGV